jgi:FdrA protein
VGRLVQALGQPAEQALVEPLKSVELATLQQPLAGINVGLESFTESLVAQGAPAIQVDWRPPAGGNEKLMDILERMRSK